MKFHKYHALGNDYIVINPSDISRELSDKEIEILCDRHYGIGADGILFGPLKSKDSDFRLQIFNPDASEAEKSGNGLRIFSRYLFDCGLVSERQFSIETKGGYVQATVHPSGQWVSVEMGKVKFGHDVEGTFSTKPILKAETITVKDQLFKGYRVSVGNPHFVIEQKELSIPLVKKFGPVIEKDKQFPNRTNVQFLKILDRKNIQIEIWERGAGYTYASGSSSTAAAALAFGLGLCDKDISVQMPGGIIEINMDKDYQATMTGPVCKIASGVISYDVFADQ